MWLLSRQTRTLFLPAACARTAATTSGATLEPSIIVIRLIIGCASIAARLWARMSMSTPTTRASAGPPHGVQLEHRRREDQRAAVRDAGLDDQLGLQRPDQLLHRDDVLRVLDDRPAEPGEVVRVLGGDRRRHEPRAPPPAAVGRRRWPSIRLGDFAFEFLHVQFPRSIVTQLNRCAVSASISCR